MQAVKTMSYTDAAFKASQLRAQATRNGLVAMRTFFAALIGRA